MKVAVNGETRTMADGTSVADVVRELGLEGKPFAVELNRSVVGKARLAETRLADGDRLEIVTLVGGG